MEGSELTMDVEVTSDYGEKEDDIVVIEKELQGSELTMDVEVTSDYGEKEDDILVIEKELQGDNVCLSGSLIGFKRSTVGDMYDLYCDHADAVGFSVRKGTSRYNNAGNVVQKLFVCSNEGSRRDMSRKSRTTHITRTNCKASMKVKLGDDGLYEVVAHFVDHNHKLSRNEWSYMHRSQRAISDQKAVIIEDLISSGVRPVDSFRYMVHEAGGEDVIGHTRKDHINFVNRLKMNAIEGGDAQTLIDRLHQNCVEDPDFFFRFKLDEDGRLCSVFWRDSMMKDDYMIFGDVVVFDTTYRTNRYNLVCAPFVGINNHWKNVMFGCAFIANEKSESFEWLFDVFKKSMGGKCPVTIFTDQDLAMSNGIAKIFPSTRHRLCIWHLYQNAISRFGNLKSDKHFSNQFQKCLSGCSNEDEFENCWSNLISTYGLGDNPWFKRLFDMRLKWCTAYSKNYFSAGILSSQRSESTNSSIGFKAKKTTGLNDFYCLFEKTVKQWRDSEAQDEFRCSKAVAHSCVPLIGFMKHAAEVYTLDIFKLFEAEFLKSIATSFTLLGEDRDLRTYKVTDADGITSHQVDFYTVDFLVCCSCKKFDECGILCCHCLRIMHVHSVPKIPDCYILKRWSKFVKNDIWDKHSNTGSVQVDKSSNCGPWRHHIIRKYYNLVLKAQENKAARRIIEEHLNEITVAVERLMSHVQADDVVEQLEVSTSSSYTTVLNPLHAVTKGRKQRIKHFQKKKKVNGGQVAASLGNMSKEFGTITPNQRLF